MAPLTERDFDYIEKFLNAMNAVLEVTRQRKLISHTSEEPHHYVDELLPSSPTRPGIDNNHTSKKTVSENAHHEHIFSSSVAKTNTIASTNTINSLPAPSTSLSPVISVNAVASAENERVTPGEDLNNNFGVKAMQNVKHHNRATELSTQSSSEHTAEHREELLSNNSFCKCEKKLWVNVSCIFWRIAALNKLHLLSYIAVDACERLTELVKSLLDYLQITFLTISKCRRLNELSELHSNRVLYMLRTFCTLSACEKMMIFDAMQSKQLYNSICEYVARQHHLTWMSLLYVTYCEEMAIEFERPNVKYYEEQHISWKAHLRSSEIAEKDTCNNNEFDKNSEAIAENVCATNDITENAIHAQAVQQILIIMFECCRSSTECALELLFTEPVACVTYLFYGIRLRLSSGKLFTQHEWKAICDIIRRNSALNEQERVVRDENICTSTDFTKQSKTSISDYEDVNTSIESSSEESKIIEHLKTFGDAANCRMESSYYFAERDILGNCIRGIHNKYHCEHTTNNIPLFFFDANCALQNNLAPKEAKNITKTGRKHSAQKHVSCINLHCCNERECKSCNNRDLRCNDLCVSQVEHEMCNTHCRAEEQVEYILKNVLQMFTSNYFECCIYSALDIVIEAVHTSRAYHHWAVMSTLSNYFVLSMKSLTTFNVAKESIEQKKLEHNDKYYNEECTSHPEVEKMLSNLQELSEPIAMYENIVDILLTFKALLSLLNGESVLTCDQRENNFSNSLQSQSELQNNREGRWKAELSKEQLGEEAVENLQSDRNTYMQVMLRLNVQSHIIRIAETLPTILEVDHVPFQIVQDLCLLDHTILEESGKNTDSNNDRSQDEEFKSALQFEQELEEKEELDAVKEIHQEEEEEICASSVPCEVSSSIKSSSTTPITSSLNAQLIETEDISKKIESLTSQNVCVRERPPLSSVQPRLSAESTHHNSSPHSNLAKSFFKSMFGVHSTCESKNTESGNIHDNVHKCMNKEAKVHVPNKTFAGLSKSIFHLDRTSKGEHSTKYTSKTNTVIHANSQMDIHHDLSNETHDTSHRHRTDTTLGRFFNKTKNKEKKNKMTTYHDEIESVGRNDSMCSDYSISTSTSSSCVSINNNNNNDNMKSEGVESIDVQDDKISKNTCVGDNYKNNINNSKEDSSINAGHSLFVVEASANEKNKNCTAEEEHETTHVNKQHEEEYKKERYKEWKTRLNVQRIATSHWTDVPAYVILVKEWLSAMQLIFVNRNHPLAVRLAAGGVIVSVVFINEHNFDRFEGRVCLRKCMDVVLELLQQYMFNIDETSYCNNNNYNNETSCANVNMHSESVQTTNNLTREHSEGDALDIINEHHDEYYKIYRVESREHEYEEEEENEIAMSHANYHENKNTFAHWRNIENLEEAIIFIRRMVKLWEHVYQEMGYTPLTSEAVLMTEIACHFVHSRSLLPVLEEQNNKGSIDSSVSTSEKTEDHLQVEEVEIDKCKLRYGQTNEESHLIVPNLSLSEDDTLHRLHKYEREKLQENSENNLCQEEILRQHNHAKLCKCQLRFTERFLCHVESLYTQMSGVWLRTLQGAECDEDINERAMEVFFILLHRVMQNQQLSLFAWKQNKYNKSKDKMRKTELEQNIDVACNSLDIDENTSSTEKISNSYKIRECEEHLATNREQREFHKGQVNKSNESNNDNNESSNNNDKTDTNELNEMFFTNDIFDKEHTVQVLSSLFALLLRRDCKMLTFERLHTLIEILSFNSTGLLCLARECLLSCFDYPQVYEFLALELNKCDVLTLSRLLPLISRYLHSDWMTSGLQHERRVWLMNSKCVDVSLSLVKQCMSTTLHTSRKWMQLVKSLFEFFSSFEGEQEKELTLTNTELVNIVQSNLSNVQNVQCFISLAQSIFDATTDCYRYSSQHVELGNNNNHHYKKERQTNIMESAENRERIEITDKNANTSSDERAATGTSPSIVTTITAAAAAAATIAKEELPVDTHLRYIGTFYLVSSHCSAEKPFFLEFIPALITFAKEHYTKDTVVDIVTVITEILSNSGILCVDSLTSFALKEKISQWLPFLELPAHQTNNLPFTGSSPELRSFWEPLLQNAPERSAMWFTGSGGVQINMGAWPNKGFSITTFYHFDSLSGILPLYEFRPIQNTNPNTTSNYRSGDNNNNNNKNSSKDKKTSTSSNITTNIYEARTEKQILLDNNKDESMQYINNAEHTFSMKAHERVHHREHSSVILTIVNGSALQLTVGERTITISTDDVCLLESFVPHSWIHVCVVLSVAQTMSVFVNGAKVAMCTCPYFLANSQMFIDIGTVQPTRGKTSSQLFGLGDIELWAEELTSPQVFAHFAYLCLTPSIPQEVHLHDHYHEWMYAPEHHTLHNERKTNNNNYNVNMDSKNIKMNKNILQEKEYLVENTSSLIDDRIARYVPYVHAEELLYNLLSTDVNYPLVAKVTGHYLSLPHNWVDYRLLWASRGGFMHMMRWLASSRSPSELERVLSVMSQVMKRALLMTTLNSRLYLVLCFWLRQHARKTLSRVACNHLLSMGVNFVTSNAQLLQINLSTFHGFISNRLIFDHVLGCVTLYTRMPLDSALYLLRNVTNLFNSCQCKYATQNVYAFDSISFLDKLLHGFVSSAVYCPFRLSRALLACAKQILLARNGDAFAFHSFASLIAMLTASESSRSINVTPSHDHYRHHETYESHFTLPMLETVRIALPFRIALRCAEMLLETLCDVTSVLTTEHITNIEKERHVNINKENCNFLMNSKYNKDDDMICNKANVKQGSLFLSNLADVIDLSWFAACMTRFASTRSVVLCTRLFLRALEASSTLRNDVLPNLSSVVEILAPHWHNDQLMLMLLTMSIGVNEEFFDLKEFESGNSNNSHQRNKKHKREDEEAWQVHTLSSSPSSLSSSLHLHITYDENMHNNNINRSTTPSKSKTFNVEKVLEWEYEVLQKYVRWKLDALERTTLHPFITPLLLKMFALRLHNSNTTQSTGMQLEALSLSSPMIEKRGIEQFHTERTSPFHFVSEQPLRVCFRLRRVLSAIRVCCRLMCDITHKRYCKSIHKVMNQITSSALMPVAQLQECVVHKKSIPIELYTSCQSEAVNTKEKILSNNNDNKGVNSRCCENNKDDNKSSQPNSLEVSECNEHIVEAKKECCEMTREINMNSSNSNIIRRWKRVFCLARSAARLWVSIAVKRHLESISKNSISMSNNNATNTSYSFINFLESEVLASTQNSHNASEECNVEKLSISFDNRNNNSKNKIEDSKCITIPTTMTKRKLPSAVTILTLCVLTHAASRPHLYFSLIGSPLETSALCSLIHNISQRSRKLASKKLTPKATQTIDTTKISSIQSNDKNETKETSAKAFEVSANIMPSHEQSHSQSCTFATSHEEEIKRTLAGNKAESTRPNSLHENCQCFATPCTVQKEGRVDSKNNTTNEKQSVNNQITNDDLVRKSERANEHKADHFSRYDSLSAIATDIDNIPEWHPPNLFRNINVNNTPIDENQETTSHFADVEQPHKHEEEEEEVLSELKEQEKEDRETKQREEEEEEDEVENVYSVDSQVKCDERLEGIGPIYNLYDKMELNEDKTATPPHVALTAVRHTSRESSKADADDQYTSETHQNTCSINTKYENVADEHLTVENVESVNVNDSITAVKRNKLSNTSFIDNVKSLSRAESSELLEELQSKEQQQSELLSEEMQAEEEVESMQETVPEEEVQSYRISRMPSSEELSYNSLSPLDNAIKVKEEAIHTITTPLEAEQLRQQNKDKSMPDSKADEHNSTKGLHNSSNDKDEFCIIEYASVQASVEEFVIAHINQFFKTLISSSLHTVPLPNWIGGLSYGSCGGLLFQTLLMTSSRVTGNNTLASATLIRFFLDQVAYCVRIERTNNTEQSTSTSHTQERSSSTQNILSKRKSERSNSPYNKDNHHNEQQHRHHHSKTNDVDDDNEKEEEQNNNVCVDNSDDNDSDISKWREHANAVMSPSTSTLSAHSHSISEKVHLSSRKVNEHDDIFLYNVARFTDLIVDMLSINILELPTAQNYFLSLLIICQGWSNKYVQRLNAQVMRACINVLNKLSTLDASLELIESMHTLCTLVMRPGWIIKDCLEVLWRVLMRVFVSVPPVWMSEEDVERRKLFIVLIFRHMMSTYVNSDELHNSLTIRTLTQRISLYDAFATILLMEREEEACETFAKYVVENASQIESWMSGRLKTKADLALKASIKTRAEYIKRITVFNQQYTPHVKVKDGFHAHELRELYLADFTSYIDMVPMLSFAHLQWLSLNNSAEHLPKNENETEEWEKCNKNTFHYFDSQRNYATMNTCEVSWGNEPCCTRSVCPKTGERVELMNANKIIPALLCEEQVNHLSALLPPLITRARPYAVERKYHSAQEDSKECDSNNPSLVKSNKANEANTINNNSTPEFIDANIKLTPSAQTLLRYLLAPHERLKFISNAFRINGIHSTPCLLLLTNVTLKLISFSFVNEQGDIILCHHLDHHLHNHHRKKEQQFHEVHNNKNKLEENDKNFTGEHFGNTNQSNHDTKVTSNHDNDELGKTNGNDGDEQEYECYEEEQEEEHNARWSYDAVEHGKAIRDVSDAKNSSNFTNLTSSLDSTCMTSTNTNTSTTTNNNNSSEKDKKHKHVGFNFSAVTRHLQRILGDDKDIKNKVQLQLRRDGTRIARAVRQFTDQTYRHLYWVYPLSSLREVRCLRYMHLNTAVKLLLYHDDGPMVSIVDASQSMNPSARTEFLQILKSVTSSFTMSILPLESVQLYTTWLNNYYFEQQQQQQQQQQEEENASSVLNDKSTEYVAWSNIQYANKNANNSVARSGVTHVGNVSIQPSTSSTITAASASASSALSSSASYKKNYNVTSVGNNNASSLLSLMSGLGGNATITSAFTSPSMLSVSSTSSNLLSTSQQIQIELLQQVQAMQQHYACMYMEDSERPNQLRAALVRWATGALSTYDYLICLNRAAGRTWKDFNQYPIFPWVLAQYQTSTIDLESASTYRDFAYPMGAQTLQRRKQVAEQFNDMVVMKRELELEEQRSHNNKMGASDKINKNNKGNTNHNDIYPFHHGTHYSTSGGVLYYLIRVQPFTTFAKIFQGGELDMASRLFDSMANCFASCMAGPADCKELIPEFYHNASFLRNADHIPFGSKADGTIVDDVELPPWSHNSIQVFTAIMREALESDYVRNHIHEWIDLIFGVRRRGAMAVERFNVFQRMTYGEEVNDALQQAETAHDCDVIIAEVDNFGQTPTQLFQERHPAYNELAPVKGSSREVRSMARSDAPLSQLHLLTTSPQLQKENKNITITSSSSSSNKESKNMRSTPASLTGSSSSGSGHTYTLAFEAHMPKTIPMLVHAHDEPQTCFTLYEIPIELLLPLPPLIVETFGLFESYSHMLRPFHDHSHQHQQSPARKVEQETETQCNNFSVEEDEKKVYKDVKAESGNKEETKIYYKEQEYEEEQQGKMKMMMMMLQPYSSKAVIGFTSVRGINKMMCNCQHVIGVDGEEHVLCWHEQETRLMRFDLYSGKYLSTVPFLAPHDSCFHITAVAASSRESLILIGLSNGAIYCMYPDTEGVLHQYTSFLSHTTFTSTQLLHGTLCTHTHAIRGFVISARYGRAVSYTWCSCDEPVVWRVQRFHSSLLYRLHVQACLPNVPQSQRQVVHVCVDDTNGYTVALTQRFLIIFDNNGKPFGLGSLPSTECTVNVNKKRNNVIVGQNITKLNGKNNNSNINNESVETVQIHSHNSSSDNSFHVADMSVVCAYECHEWASGIKLYFTGHQDGSIGLWRATRLPPDSVAIGRVAVVEFHALLINGSETGVMGHSLGAVTALVQEQVDVPRFYVGYSTGKVRQFSFDDTATVSQSTKIK